MNIHECNCYWQNLNVMNTVLIESLMNKHGWIIRMRGKC